MSLVFKSFRVRTDDEVTEGLQYVSERQDASNFSVLSIKQINNFWVVFYSVEVKREPPNHDWIETSPVNRPESWTSDPEEIKTWYGKWWRHISDNR